MKKSIMATFGVAASLAGVQALNNQASASTGYLDASYTNSSLDNQSDIHAVTVGGGVAFGHLGAMKLQLNGDIGTVSSRGRDETAYDVTGHFYHQNSDYLIGGFLSYGHVNDINSLPTGSGLSDISIGAQGQLYMSNLTLSGDVQYGEVHDISTNYWRADAGAGFFLSDNLRLDVGALYDNATSHGTSASVWGANVGAEYVLSGPFSIFGGYAYERSNQSDTSGNTLKAGVRYNFGSPTLKQRNRTGADLGTARGFLRDEFGL